MKINNIILRQTFDSRSQETIKVCLISETNNKFCSQIPSGKSRGKNEAAVLDFNQANLVLENEIKPSLIKQSFNSISELDRFLIGLDTTPNKSKLGGNLVLGISLSFAKALAWQKNQELWQLINNEFFNNKDNSTPPLIFSNLINGGVHASSNLAIQEYLLVVRSKEQVLATVKKLINFYAQLGEVLKEKLNLKTLALGDEAGYNANFKDNLEPLEILENLIFSLKLDGEFALALDAAANSFYKNGKYSFGSNEISSQELKVIYQDYFEKSKLLFSVEDPFNEEDWESFKNLKNFLKNKWIVGDDLTVTNSELIKKFSSQGLINAVIIKPNQIGSLSEACQAINVARHNGLKIIVSHRSGETEDNFIVHLAKASNADGIKIGAPARERIFKFNELVRLYS